MTSAAARLEAPQLAALLEAARTTVPRWYALFSTLAFTGMRIGEATALKWSDLDETKGVIRVRRSHWRGEVGSTKTDTNRAAAGEPGVDPPGSASCARRASGARARDGLGVPERELRCHASPRKPLLEALEAAGITERFTIHSFVTVR